MIAMGKVAASIAAKALAEEAAMLKKDMTEMSHDAGI